MMIEIRPMIVTDIPAARTLWQASAGICLGIDDEPEALGRYLNRNPEMSFVAMAGDQLAGVSLAGHEGRRGLLHHVAVHPSWQGQDIGRQLVDRCMCALAKHGITKVHIMVLAGNHDGLAFWRKLGWNECPDVKLLSMSIVQECESNRGS